MCEGSDHFCSGCGANVDSGTFGEYKVFDFRFALKDVPLKAVKPPGVETERTVLCKRCLEDPKNKELLALIDVLSKAPPPPGVKKLAMREGIAQCNRCGRRLTDKTPHVNLSIAWDVEYRSIRDVAPYNICKRCYSSDVRLREVWKYLAKLGKNPTFEPRIVCQSWTKCATFEPGPFPFNCKFIRVGKDDGFALDRNRLSCARHHPRTWKFPELPGHAPQSLTPRSLKMVGKKVKMVRGIGGLTPEKVIVIAKRAAARYKVGLKQTKDPVMVALLSGQLDMLRAMLGPLGVKL